jgi:Uma2 family endonuclease
VLVGEVLSPATADWDLDGKFRGYRTLASLRHYVVVAQTHQEVKHFARQDDGSWRMTVHGPGEAVHLRDHDITVPVDAIYARVELVGGPGPGTPAPGPRRAPVRPPPN